MSFGKIFYSARDFYLFAVSFTEFFYSAGNLFFSWVSFFIVGMTLDDFSLALDEFACKVDEFFYFPAPVEEDLGDGRAVRGYQRIGVASVRRIAR